MLKIIFFQFICIFFVSHLYSQTISIDNNGCPFSNCTAAVDPSTSFSYTANANAGSGNTFLGVKWTTVGAPQPAIANPTNITWDNTPNTNVHSVFATMSYSRNGGATQTVVSPTINVTVKHIAQITTMTASGSVSGSFTNGSSVIIPCGVKTITFSVTTPTIDPTNSSVVFSWVKPSSWSGSSTSNSITLTTDAGQTNGQVRLDYRRADGAFIQSFTVNIVRPRVNNPLINGGALQVCAGAPINLTSSAGNNPTTAQWIPSGGVVVNSQTLTSATVTANSTGTILYTANNDCLSPASTPPRDIIVGIPTISFSYVNGNPSSGFNYVSTDPTLLVAGTSFSGVSYTWTIDGGSGSIYPNSGSCSAYIYGQFLRVKVTLSNSCGTGESYFFYLFKTGGSFYKMTSPNPTSNAVSLTMDKDVAQYLLKSVTLVSDVRTSVVKTYDTNASRASGAFKTDPKITFDVSTLPRGRYFMNIVYEGTKSFTEMVILE